MPHPYSLTIQACHQYRRLGADLRKRVDKVILGLRLVPTVGLYDKQSGQFNANVGGHLRITYRILSMPEPQVVILQIRPLSERWAHLEAIGAAS